MKDLNSIKVANMLNSLIDNINEQNESLAEQQSVYDLEQQDILHLIENKKLTAPQASQVLKLLRNVRTKRRDVKSELSRYHALTSRLTNANSDLLTKKIELKENNIYYEFKTDVLKNILDIEKGHRMSCGTVVEIQQPYSIGVLEVKTTDTDVCKKISELDDADTELIDAVLEHPEGKRIIMTNNSTGAVTETKNFEKAVMVAIGHKSQNLKPSEFIKNVSGIMKAIKLGNDYLGYKWEVKQ